MSPTTHRSIGAGILVALLAATMPTTHADASLRAALVPRALRGGGVLENAIGPLGRVIATQVATQIPSFATSAGFTYRYDPELELFTREATTLGPVFAERALTIGRGRFNVQTSYTYIKFERFNGRDLDHLVNRFEYATPSDGGPNEFYGLEVSGGGASRDIRVALDLDVEAQVFDFSFTYGLLDDLDLNVDLPVLRTFVRSTVSGTTPDPRCVEAGSDDPNGADLKCLEDFAEDGSAFDTATLGRGRDSALGIGDMRLRAKYNPLRTPVALSGLVDLVLPTGDQANFQGTGDTRLGTLLIASREWKRLFELHVLGGVEWALNDFDHSQARYVAGGTVQLGSWAAVTVDMIGRSEFVRRTRVPNSGRLPAVRDGKFEQTFNELFNDPPPDGFTGRPYFVDVKRNDVIDLSLGLKIPLGQQALFFANVVVPLNDDGIRADFVPTAGFELNFGTP